jgi:glycosyltransferase involved in cell wall biosynthesis
VRRPRIAYLTNAYPSVSHTFIRRELVAVEELLGPVERFSVRGPGDLVGADDVREAAATTALLRQPPRRWLAAAAGAARRPVRLGRAARAAVRLGRRSHRGVLVHLVYLAEAALLADELRRRGVDHLHVHFGTNPAAVALLARALGGPPWSFTVHGPDELDAPVALSLADKVASAAFVAAFSDFTAAQLRRWLPADRWDDVHVVRCAVDESFVDAVAPIDPASTTLVSVGRLVPQKQPVLLVEAFADAVEGGLDAELVLAGDGELRGDVERVAARRGVADRVRITGWLDGDAVRREVLAARALVLPSAAEGLPVVLMEALALGRPVVTTFVAGIPELVVDGASGWLVPAGSREGLAKAIAEAVHAPVEELEAMAAVGRGAVLGRHRAADAAAALARLLAAA